MDCPRSLIGFVGAFLPIVAAEPQQLALDLQPFADLWKARQRAFPGSTRTAHGSPCRFRAPHVGRSLRRSGAPFPSSPISRIAIQVDATLHSKLSQVVPRRGQAKNSYFMPRPPRREINSAAGRRTCCNYASEFQFTRPLFIASSITKTFETCHSYQFPKTP